MDVIDAIHSRRSIRSYQSNLVDRGLIDSVIWDAARRRLRSVVRSLDFQRD